MVLSVIVALILTPALCATLLKPATKATTGPQRGFFGWFNRNFDRGVDALPARRSRGVIEAPGAGFMLIYGGHRGRSWRCCSCACRPRFLPDEDQGFDDRSAISCRPAPRQTARSRSASRSSTTSWSTRRPTSTACSPSPASASPATARTPAWPSSHLKDWNERKGAQNRAQRHRPARQQVPSRASRDAMVFAFVPPPVPELGNSSGFDLELEDRGGLGHASADGGAQPAARHGGQGSQADRPCARTAWTTRRSCKLDIDQRQRRRARPVAGRRQRHPERRLGRRLHQRLRRPRPGQAGLHAGRRAVPQPARGPRPLVRARRQRRRWRRSRPSPPPHWTFGPPRLERYNGAAGAGDPGPAGAGPELGRGDGRDGEAGRPAAARHRLRMDRPVLSRRSCRAPRRRRSTPCRCWSSSCAWRRSTRAGRCRSR